MTAIGTRQSPIHPLAWLAFLTSILAIVLACYGSIAAEKRITASPLNVARGADVDAGSGKSVEVIGFVMPFVLGIAATLAGGSGMRRIEKADGKFRGDAVAVFAILLGGLAAVIGGCMMMAVYGWRYIPALYSS